MNFGDTILPPLPDLGAAILLIVIAICVALLVVGADLYAAGIRELRCAVIPNRPTVASSPALR